LAPPLKLDIDPVETKETKEQAEKALRAAGGSPAVAGGNLGVSKTGRVRKVRDLAAAGFCPSGDLG
jgi:hypothetical protein